MDFIGLLVHLDVFLHGLLFTDYDILSQQQHDMDMYYTLHYTITPFNDICIKVWDLSGKNTLHVRTLLKSM